MTEIKGVTWDFGGWRLDRKNALAACYARGFTGHQRVVTAACVMTAESQRYTKAWHHNHEHLPGTNEHVISNETGQPVVLSTDRGLFQINDRAHPDLEVEDMYRAKWNVDMAFEVYLRRGRSFGAWAAYNSGNYLRYWPEFELVHLRGIWRERIPFWEDE